MSRKRKRLRADKTTQNSNLSRGRKSLHHKKLDYIATKLKDYHATKLIDEHGLSTKTIEEAGLYSSNSDEINRILKRNDIQTNGIVIPYDDGNFKRVRLDNPIIIDGNEAKYLSPSGSKNKLYIPSKVEKVLDDSQVPLFITEGEFKALKATQEGFCCIGLPGIWGFKSDNKLLSEFGDIDFRNREIVIVLDNDASYNFNVLQGGIWLAIELAKLGAQPKIITLPEIEGDILLKIGLDDYLLTEDPDKFQSLVEETSYNKSILDIQKRALKLLEFSESQKFNYECCKGSTTFIKDGLKIKIEGQVKDCTITVFRKVSSNYDLLCKEELDLTKSSKKSNLVKVSSLEKDQSEELRKFIDLILEFYEIKAKIDRVETKIKTDFKKDYPHELSLSKDKRDRALYLAKSPDLLYQIRKILEQSGLVGEKVNSLLIYLALTSRILEKPISIVVKAGSSAGKSFLLKKVLQLFPEDAYIELTGLSPKSLIYMEESFSHRFLIVYEAHGVSDDDYTDYIIRTLLSENKIKYATVEKNRSDKNQTRIVEKEGPTGLITTTTSPSIHDENETRLFSITIEEDSSQTQNIKGCIAEHYMSVKSDDIKSFLEDFRNLQKIIKPVKVVIPYAKELSELTPSEPLRVRRDFERILVVIEAIALLHQHQREVKMKDGVEYIEATLEDYYIAKKLLSETLDVTILDKYPQTVEIVEAVNLIYEENNKPVLVKDLETKFNKSKKTISRWLKPALEHGWIENVGEDGRGKPFKLVPGKFEKQKFDFLPSVSKLAAKWGRTDIEDFSVINPITGKRIKLKKQKKHKK